MIQLAEHLHKFVYEVRDMPSSEFDTWMTYFRIKEKRQQAEDAKNKVAGKNSGQKENTFG